MKSLTLSLVALLALANVASADTTKKSDGGVTEEAVIIAEGTETPTTDAAKKVKSEDGKATQQ